MKGEIEERRNGQITAMEQSRRQEAKENTEKYGKTEREMARRRQRIERKTLNGAFNKHLNPFYVCFVFAMGRQRYFYWDFYLGNFYEKFDWSFCFPTFLSTFIIKTFALLKCANKFSSPPPVIVEYSQSSWCVLGGEGGRWGRQPQSGINKRWRHTFRIQSPTHRHSGTHTTHDRHTPNRKLSSALLIAGSFLFFAPLLLFFCEKLCEKSQHKLSRQNIVVVLVQCTYAT